MSDNLKACANGACTQLFAPKVEEQLYCSHRCRKWAQATKARERKKASEKSVRLIDNREIRQEMAEFIVYIVTGDADREPADTHWDMADRFLRVIELRYKL